MSTGTYDEALERLHAFGPEFDGYLSNHGPMVVETLSRHGLDASVHPWTDHYLRRLDDPPRARDRIVSWQEALGDPRRAGDWVAYFRVRVTEGPWPEVLEEWWPRLLPGIAAGATHGLIRVGHSLQALRVEETPPRVEELAHALAYWASRWQPIPLVRPTGRRTPDQAIAALPGVQDQSGGIRPRLAQLATTHGYVEGMAALLPAATVSVDLECLVDAAVRAYGRFATGNPTMLVHAATAPNAVRMALPSLPREMARDSFDAAWSATAAVIAAYRPSVPIPAPHSVSADTIWERALHHGGEHVLKFTDTAWESFRRTQDADAIGAIATAIRLDA